MVFVSSGLGSTQGFPRTEPIVWPSAEAADNPKLQRFADFWAGRSRDGKVMPRTALDPLAMPRDALGWLILSERLEARIYRYRLFGTYVTQVVGRDLTGYAIDPASMKGSESTFLDMLEEVVAARSPIFLHGGLWWEHQPHRQFQQVTVPLSDEAGNVRYACTRVDFIN